MQVVTQNIQNIHLSCRDQGLREGVQEVHCTRAR